MAIRGQRFQIDLDEGEEDHRQSGKDDQISTRNPWSLVRDIQERSTSSSARSPSPPRTKGRETGFPAHGRRKPSRFKQEVTQKDAESNSKGGLSKSVTSSQRSVPTAVDAMDERQKIDLENQQRIAEMSDHDIDNARRQLMTDLSPSFIERLLKKANIDDEASLNGSYGVENGEELPPRPTNTSTKKVTFDDNEAQSSAIPESLVTDPSSGKPDSSIMQESSIPPPPQSAAGYPIPPPIHFPEPAHPSLDPNDPNFLEKFHSTYFPSLSTNPNALSWMQPPDPVENQSYSPSLDGVPPYAIRFDFRGRILPPKLAAQIPPTKGLHHHASAPEAAGYTIPELAHLSRSSFPAQRCIAYQTLGRILYRLGTGFFGPEDDDLWQGLWHCIEKGRVIDTLTEEAARSGEGGNRSCWVTATEAIWLWRKGGGRRLKAA